MNANRKSATVHTLHPNNGVGTKVERNIVTTYYVDGRKTLTIATTRSKYPRAAVQRAADYLSMYHFANENYIARVAEIYDESNGQHHATVRMYMEDNRIETTYHRDPRKAGLAGTSKDQFGTFASKRAKSRMNIKHRRKAAA